jgi:hypothetical protein
VRILHPTLYPMELVTASHDYFLSASDKVRPPTHHLLMRCTSGDTDALVCSRGRGLMSFEWTGGFALAQVRGLVAEKVEKFPAAAAAHLMAG